MIFGRKSERFVQEDPGQFFLGLDIQQEEVPEAKTEEVSYTRKKLVKQKETPIRLPLPSHLQCKEILVEPEEGITRA